MNVHVSVLQEEEIKIGLESEIIQGGGTVSGDYIPVPSTAEVGQTIVVKAVDENGKPTAWEAVDMPSGGGGASVELDTTLTQSGKAADAKSVGDALAEKQPKGDYLTKNELPDMTAYRTAEAQDVIDAGKQDTLIQSGATVGQIAKITAVDDNGKPTEWEAADMDGGEKAWKYEKYVEFSEETAGFEFTAYDDETPFDFTEVEISAALKNAATEAAWGDVTVISDGSVVGSKNEKIGGTDSSVSIHTKSGKWYFCFLRGHIDAKNKSIEAMTCVDANILYVNSPLILRKNTVFQKPNYCYSVNAEQNHWYTPPTKFTTIKSDMTIGAGSSILIRGR